MVNIGPVRKFAISLIEQKSMTVTHVQLSRNRELNVLNISDQFLFIKHKF